ncbi:hypothetical protein E2C01_041762 [Portunus trituberculatus]|uniref:Uncharacterized protein n=1 Tax=Portunus trituberculatus TaxID=210409 RepID=A0A5B7FSQ1_PORTR|nr:hypothetical protein [Portunus trituberculatus]
MAAFPAFPIVLGGYVILEAFVTKVSEVEAEFHRRISEVWEEFRGRISDLQTEFCRVNSAPEGVAVSAVSLPSNETHGQKEWRVVSSGAKRRKILRAPQLVETSNSFAMLECVDEEREREKAGGKIVVVSDSQMRHLDSGFCAKDRKRRTRVCLSNAGMEKVSAQLDTCLADGTKPLLSSARRKITFVR